MVESYDVKFWAERFFEHFQMIKKTAKKNGIELPLEIAKQVNDLENQWRKIQQNPQSIKNNRQLLDLSVKMKAGVRQIFVNEEIPCLPDLFHHMMEEVEYFRGAILDNKYSLMDELKWWAHEHAENLDFVNCQLHELIAEDSFVARIFGKPSHIEQMLAENAKLSEMFKELDSETSEKKLFSRLSELKVKHLAGVSNLIQNVHQFPLAEDTKKMVYDMLTHESLEADYAFERITNLMGK